jgi:hypothetical protein
MGLVFVTAGRDPGSEGLDGREPLAHIDYGGVYFFLYAELRRLREATGESIDPQDHAYFTGPALDQLDQFLSTAQQLATRQPSDWQQRVGTMQGGKVWFQQTSRVDVLELLRRLADAVRTAREQNMGVLFWGE